ncbi:MAG: D-2-hydroxyacid dehydrogenase family protein [Alphaproteobacteria bacterium]|nr:D-2-hydroxyacid dehydrogenase family protein [Alphaproteobacteria bacterium]
MRLAILDDFQDVVRSVSDWSAIEDRVEITVFDDHLDEVAEVARRLEPFEIVVVIRERTKFPRALLEKLPNLKLLVTGGMRNRGIDLAATGEFGVTVCGTESLGSPTSELTWGLILATVRNIPAQVSAVHDGGWQLGLGPGLEGKTLGVIGLGRLGTAVARVGLAFGMDVAAWSQNLTKERCAEHDVRFVATLEALLAQSDIVSIHLVLSDRSRGTIDAEALSHMKPSAYLINTSRGPIVDEDALIAAVKGGKIAGAGLDVFDIEPLPADHPYRNTAGIVATPHLGYTSRENYQKYFDQGIENIDAWLKGAPIRVMEE